MIDFFAFYILCDIRYRDHDHKLKAAFFCVDIHRTAVFFHRALDTAHTEAVEAAIAFCRCRDAVHNFQLGRIRVLHTDGQSTNGIF